jgi:hypothetical protein
MTGMTGWEHFLKTFLQQIINREVMKNRIKPVIVSLASLG